MSNKEQLIRKLMNNPITKTFSVRDLDKLLSSCGCVKMIGGRGSAIKYKHLDSGKVLIFDKPHPGNNLYRYHIMLVRRILKTIREVEE